MDYFGFVRVCILLFLSKKELLAYSLPALQTEALNNFPIIDGHNDLAYNILINMKNNIKDLKLDQSLKNDSIMGTQACQSCHTDIPRLREGKVGAQFWSAFILCSNQYDSNAVGKTLEQIDVIKRVVNKYAQHLKFATSSNEILEVIKEGKIASLIGVEGGHSISSSLAVLRAFYDLGVRYMTLTHTCNTPWAEASPSDDNTTSHFGLTPFGEVIVKEMNRLGMLVDLSHVSYTTMKRALEITKAPVIFSHSSSYKIRPHHRNVKDDILQKLKENRGIIMVNFYTDFVTDKDVASIEDVANHINHIADIAGVDHIGIGGDYDGVDKMPVGLEDVSKYPALIDYLAKNNPTRWTTDNLEKLAGRNIVRVFKEVEKVQEQLKSISPYEDKDIVESKMRRK